MEGLTEDINTVNSVPTTTFIELAGRAVQRRRGLTAFAGGAPAFCTSNHVLHHRFIPPFNLKALLTKITVSTIRMAVIEASKTPTTASTKTNSAAPTTTAGASQFLTIWWDSGVVLNTVPSQPSTRCGS
jgi:hypothetical protein